LSLLKFFEWTHWPVVGWGGDIFEKIIGAGAIATFLVGFLLLIIAVWRTAS